MVGATSCEREERQRHAAFACLEDRFHLGADLELLEVAIDEVGIHARALAQRHITERERALGRSAHDGIGVDLAFTGARMPFGVPLTKRTQRAWVPVELPAT